MSARSDSVDRFAVRGLATLLALVVLVLLLGSWLLNPPREDLLRMASLLLSSGLLTLLLGYVATRAARGKALRTIGAKLLFVLVLSTGLALLNVGATAYLMFLSGHDLKLLLLLLIFSLRMSCFVALAIAGAFNSTLGSLMGASEGLRSATLPLALTSAAATSLLQLSTPWRKRSKPPSLGSKT